MTPGALLLTVFVTALSAVWPLAPRPDVVHGFDPPSSMWGAGHRGVDLVGHLGQEVRASRGGVITFAGRLAGKGVVVVSHGATRTTYEPVAASVSVGDHVSMGQTIGHLELAMSHCFPRACLHWGLLRGDTYLDPLTLVGAGPIRLLPPDGSPALRLAAPPLDPRPATSASRPQPGPSLPFSSWQPLLTLLRPSRAP